MEDHGQPGGFPAPRQATSLMRGDNWQRCCICFEVHEAPYPNLYRDEHGQIWDFCKGQCAHDAGMD